MYGASIASFGMQKRHILERWFSNQMYKPHFLIDDPFQTGLGFEWGWSLGGKCGSSGCSVTTRSGIFGSAVPDASSQLPAQDHCSFLISVNIPFLLSLLHLFLPFVPSATTVLSFPSLPFVPLDATVSNFLY